MQTIPSWYSSIPGALPEPKDTGEEIPWDVAHLQQQEGKLWRAQTQFSGTMSLKASVCKNHPYNKDFLPNINLQKIHYFSLKPFIHHPYPCQKSFSSFHGFALYSPFYEDSLGESGEKAEAGKSLEKNTYHLDKSL